MRVTVGDMRRHVDSIVKREGIAVRPPLQQHLAALTDADGPQFKLMATGNPRRIPAYLAAMADPDERVLYIGPIKGHLSYGTVMHELGHILHPRGGYGSTGKWEAEVNAWEWAIDNAIIDKQLMRRQRSQALWVHGMPLGGYPLISKVMLGAEPPLNYEPAPFKGFDEYVIQLRAQQARKSARTLEARDLDQALAGILQEMKQRNR